MEDLQSIPRSGFSINLLSCSALILSPVEGDNIIDLPVQTILMLKMDRKTSTQDR